VQTKKYAFFAPVLAWALACGETVDPGNSAGGGGVPAAGSGGAAGAGTPSTGGTSSGGTASGAGGTGGATTGGTSSEGGSAPGGQGGAAAGSVSGGSGGGAGTFGGGGNATGGNGGASPTGGSAGAGGGSGGSGGGSTACTRELLSSTTDAYFTALAAHDPSSLPLAGTVKFTENGEVMPLGEEGLWETAGALVYKHTALDVQECSAMSQAVVPDGAMNIPFALRLKLVAGRITEIETIAVRPGDYSLGASNTAALAASATSVGWDTPVPMAERNTREEIVAWMNKYFRMFPAGVCNTTSACRRIENGGGNFMCLAGASCSPNQPGPNDDELVPRLILADVERGLGVGFTMFQGNTDMHIFKMYGDQVHGVSAVLGQAGSPGW
jgi:hypothetical protein